MTSAGLSVGVDIGGTFTDCTIMHDGGRITTGKSPTTPDDRSRGFFDAIASAATNMGSTLESVMQRCDLLVHGTTTGTNAIVERRGAAMGLLATRGHDDVMFIMKGQGRTAGLSPDEALDVHSTRRPSNRCRQTSSSRWPVYRCPGRRSSRTPTTLSPSAWVGCRKR